MVLKPEPMLAAIRAAHARVPEGSPRIYLSAQGEVLGQKRVQELSELPGFVLVAGRYEGLDERVIELGIDREVSIGDYVLSGGELPALVLIDAVARLIPGALGDERSSVEESHRSRAAGLAALHTARSVRGSRGTAGAIVRQLREHREVAIERGRGAHAGSAGRT